MSVALLYLILCGRIIVSEVFIFDALCRVLLGGVMFSCRIARCELLRDSL